MTFSKPGFSVDPTLTVSDPRLPAFCHIMHVKQQANQKHVHVRVFVNTQVSVISVTISSGAYNVVNMSQD